MIILSLLGPYVDFKREREKGEKHTLEDLYNSMDKTYFALCFVPVFNAAAVTLSLIYLLILPLWNKIKNIRI